MRPITGTHVYTYFACPHAVALDFHGDRGARRPLREDEEFVLQRGREHEARVVAALAWPEPEYDRGDFAAGAAATADLLRAGVPGVSQGVLVSDQRLGIPDLLRREPGASDFGDHHYVVGDVKSSRRPRSDQVLQVAFYSELLAELQGRVPEYGYLILKDGGEERFELGPFSAALRQILDEIHLIRADRAHERPSRTTACGSCRWSELCDAELLARDDLSLLSGMTRGVRTVLESIGIATCAAVESMAVDRVARTTRLEPALLRRLQASARARAVAAPVPDRTASVRGMRDAACLHFLSDPFEDRVLYMGLVHPAEPGGRVSSQLPRSRADEWSAFERLIREVPTRAVLLHYGHTVPRWFEEHGHARVGGVEVERRFVDLVPRLRGAAVYPAPVFGLADYVELGLGRDPHRAGRAAGAALHHGDAGWLARKGEADLRDLTDLRARWLDRTVPVG